VIIDGTAGGPAIEIVGEAARRQDEPEQME